MTDTFKVKDGTAHYRAESLSESQASDLGCPGADTMLIGNIGHIVGSMSAVTGRLVRVPCKGWHGSLGVLSVFTPWNGQGETLKGWLISPYGQG